MWTLLVYGLVAMAVLVHLRVIVYQLAVQCKAQRCYESQSRQLKMKVKIFFRTSHGLIITPPFYSFLTHSHVPLHTHTHTHTHSYTYTHTSILGVWVRVMRECMLCTHNTQHPHIATHTPTQIHMHIHTHARTHTHITHTRSHVHTCMYVLDYKPLPHSNYTPTYTCHPRYLYHTNTIYSSMSRWLYIV